MFSRLRAFASLGCFVVLILLLLLWISGRALVLSSYHFAESRSQVFIEHGGLQIDYTGLPYSLRDWRMASLHELFVGRLDKHVSEEARAATDDGGLLVFRLLDGFTRPIALQDLADSAGRPITTGQTIPLKIVTLPLILVLLVLSVLPAMSLRRWIRRPRAALLPFRFVWHYRLALLLALLTAYSLLWFGLQRWEVSIEYGHQGRFRHVLNSAVLGSYVDSKVFRPDLWPADVIIDVTRARASRGRLGVINAITFGGHGLEIPHWLIVSPLLILLTTSVCIRLWGRRIQPGHCLHCDYDLRASVVRCPECGRPIVAGEKPPKPWRQQIRFVAAAAFLLGAILLCVAWLEGQTTPASLLSVQRDIDDGFQGGTVLRVQDGLLELLDDRRGRPADEVISLPVWIPILGLLAFSTLLFWLARRQGRPER